MSIGREDLCLHRLFEQQARRTPEAIALADAHGSLTYEELDGRAGRLTAYLQETGVRPDEVAGIYMERCAGFVVACLAILKAGGAFLPLELAYPSSLLSEVLEDSAPRVVLTKRRYAERLPEGQKTLYMDEGWEGNPGGAPGTGEAPQPGPDNLAFIAYSSGTTGKPKGIANPHRAAVRSYRWRFGISDYGPGDRVGCNVFFIWEVLRPLLRGATSIVIPDDVIYDPGALIRFLEDHRVTETLMTPSLLEAVLNTSGPDVGERLKGLKTLWLNGEVVTKTLARRAMRALPATRLLNVYSISETHEVAAGDLSGLVDSTPATYCPVGPPMDPGHTYLLDEGMRPVPEGEAGELYVGGECLARGYVNLPEVTAERFVEDPFSPEKGARMYRTGDRGRLLPDGSLEILGRVDFMVKIRGYSVELGAVEAAVERHLAVHNCVVVADGEEGEDKRLVAYLVPCTEEERGDRFAGWRIDGRSGRSPEIRRRLQESLPHYAIPAVFVEMESLPLQETTGKVDRSKLPEPPARVAPAARDRVERLAADAPRSEKEGLLARIWEEVLRLEEGDIQREDDFFDVGGHSLVAAELLTRVEEAFGVRLSVGVILESPTLAGMCDEIENLQRGGADRGRRPAPKLREEAVLEPEISPERPASGAVPALSDAQRVFLTGATGFLGAFLLDELLSRTDAEIYCLARPRRDASPIAAVRDNLEQYGLWREDRAHRVVPVSGDLKEPLLGMPEEEFGELARNLDLVIHAAARVNLVYPYSALEPSNVGGTREVLRLACRHGTKPLHHVSTNGIFPPGSGVCEEDASLDALAGAREDGYGQTKWVSEKLVRQAEERGLPVSVYRPGNISGHSDTGASNPRDLLTTLIAESLRVEAAPRIEGWRMEMTPVDFVSAAICHIADRPDAAGGTFHLANPDPAPAEAVFDGLEEIGYPLERFEYPDWLEVRRDSPPGGEDGDIAGGILPGAEPEAHELWDGNIYDDRNTRQALRGSGLRRPELDAELFGAYARHFAERGWIGDPPGGSRSGPREKASRG